MNRLTAQFFNLQLPCRQILHLKHGFTGPFKIRIRHLSRTSSKLSPESTIKDFNNQSTIVDDTGQGQGVHISKLCHSGKGKPHGKSRNIPGCSTIFDIFQKSVKLLGDSECLGWRPETNAPYKWLTYNEVNDRAKAFGDGLVALGLTSNNETRIGVYSQNRKEFFISDIGMQFQSMCPVPIYNTVELKNLMYIINHANVCTVICDNNAKIEKLLDIRKDVPEMRTIIALDSVSNHNLNLAKETGINVLHIDEVEKLGQDNPKENNPPLATDLATICFTSGTTGQPKGVMLSHSNMVSCSSGILRHLEWSGVKFDNEEIIISYLPLAHIYERFLELSVMAVGGKIGYFAGDISKLIDDLGELKPTIVPAVPRLLNRIHDRVFADVNKSAIKKSIFNLVLNKKKNKLRRHIQAKDTFMETSTFSRIRKLMGGRVKIICTGSAPINPTVLVNLTCMLGCPIVEGYGQTENSGLASVGLSGDANTGHVGPPLCNTLIKLVDVPEMNYYTKNNQGEIYLKGPAIFQGYFKKPEKTAEVLSEDGWLQTGDIGTWTKQGCLKIIDRRKHIFKLSQGEFIAPEKVENVIMQSTYVAQIFVHGDAFQDCLVCIVTPDKDGLELLAKRLNKGESMEKLVLDEEIKQSILENLQVISKDNGLTPLETVRDVYIYPEEFTVENGLLTPTMKLKRQDARNRFNDELELMYKNINAEKARVRQLNAMKR